MSVTKKDKKTVLPKGSAEVDTKVDNYEKEPFFVKKAAEAKKFLKKVGLPEEFKTKKSS